MDGSAKGAPQERTILGALLLVQVLFAGMSVSGKFILPYVPALPLALCRLLAGAAVLMILERLLVRAPRPPLRDLGTFALLALLGVVLNQGLFLLGLDRTSATHAVLIIATIPAWTLLVATVLRHERATLAKAGGLALSFGGVALLVLSSGAGAAQGSLVGNLLIATNALSYSTYLVLSRPVLARYDPLTVIAWVFVFGALEMGLVAMPGLLTVDWQALSTEAWVALVYMVVGATILTYGINNWTLRYAVASRVASFVYLQPLIGVLLAAWLLDERLTPIVIASGALILGGVYLANRARPVRRAGTPV